MKNVIAFIATVAASSAGPAAVAGPAANPWNGTWALIVARSSPGAEGAPEAYRFNLRGKSIIWEIPSLGEVVAGRTDGRPMVIRRHGKSAGMTLSVTAPSRGMLRYRLARNGAYVGGGLMVLVDDGNAWVDVSWGPSGPPQASQLIYEKKS